MLPWRDRDLLTLLESLECVGLEVTVYDPDPEGVYTEHTVQCLEAALQR